MRIQSNTKQQLCLTRIAVRVFLTNTQMSEVSRPDYNHYVEQARSHVINISLVHRQPNLHTKPRRLLKRLRLTWKHCSSNAGNVYRSAIVCSMCINTVSSEDRRNRHGMSFVEKH